MHSTVFMHTFCSGAVVGFLKHFATCMLICVQTEDYGANVSGDEESEADDPQGTLTYP